MSKFEKNIEWITYEYPYKKKNTDWFWYVASITLFAVVISIMLRNFLFSVLVVIAAFTFVLIGLKKPKKLKFSLNSRGINIGRNSFPYGEIESFWVNYDPPFKKELILKLKKKFSQHIKIPISDTDPNKVRNFLLKILPEKEHEETLTETITESIGF